MKNNHVINYQMLARAVREKIEREGLNMDTAPAIIGISRSTLFRVLRGYGLSGELYFKVCRWLGVPFETFSSDGRGVPEMSTLDKIDMALLRDGSLTREQAVILSDMMRAGYKAVKGDSNGTENR